MIPRWPWRQVSLGVILLLTSSCGTFTLAEDPSLTSTTSTTSTCDVWNHQFVCPSCEEHVNVTDCMVCDGYTNTDYDHQLCFKRRLFSKMNTSLDADLHYHYHWEDIIGFFLWLLVAPVLASCHLGGGTIFVPLSILLLKFSPSAACGISQCTILGMSVGGILLHAGERYPKRDIRHTISTLSPQDYVAAGGLFYSRPRIPYDVLLFLAPLEIAGALWGVMLQRWLPNWLVLGLSSGMLGVTGGKIFHDVYWVRKHHSTRNDPAKGSRRSVPVVEVSDGGEDTRKSISEEEMMEEEEEEQDRESDQTSNSTDVFCLGDSMISISGDGVNVSINSIASSEEDPLGSPSSDHPHTNLEHCTIFELRQRLVEADARQYPKEKIISLAILWIGLLIISILRGDKGYPSPIGITCQSHWYYVLLASQFLWTFGYAIMYGRQLLIAQAERHTVDYPFLSHDVMWDVKKLRFYSIYTFLAGMISGFMGGGVGLFLGPLMLFMGMHPLVSKALIVAMIFMTTSSLTVCYILSGLLPLDYAIFFLVTGLFGVITGKKHVDSFLEDTNSKEYFLLLIISLTTVGLLLLTISGLRANHWCFTGLNSFCDDSFLSCLWDVDANDML